ncbi:MAG: HD-GYP domain-containing protein [Methylophilus sp.]|uniref:HD-GYP domain-containing protein n=1 Tax=Methylophilus sp. TaxID=29541 RepID=UPI002B9E24B7|nr:HD domain-containing phosphohydrolase [Methylophilus sp.]HSH86000.1 HD domain-containing phosphohydrolase [Methylophilus sp.]
MPNHASDTFYIDIEQLQIGLYIHLDLGWMDHPFSISNFKVTEESQIETIKSLGLTQLRYDPRRSSSTPLRSSNYNNVVEFPLKKAFLPKLEVIDDSPELSTAQKKQLALKHAITESEQKFLKASSDVWNIQKMSVEHPDKAFGLASNVVHELVSSTLTEGDVAIHAMNGHRIGDQHYQHELNILVLSMLLAKNLDISDDDAIILGMAAILHDIGKRQISDKILLKKDPLTLRETAIYQTHVVLGMNMLKEISVPRKILSIIGQHHEFADGSGYPKGLLCDEIDPLSHVLIIANMYDNLCNPSNPALAKTPYEALSIMFAQQRHQFDQTILRRFIKCLGIYPPGSVIRLSDQKLATVLSTNPQQPLRPFIQMLTGDDDEDGEIIDLREVLDLNIIQCLKPEQLPTILQKMMRQKQRTSYFLDKVTSV